MTFFFWVEPAFASPFFPLNHGPAGLVFSFGVWANADFDFLFLFFFVSLFFALASVTPRGAHVIFFFLPVQQRLNGKSYAIATFFFIYLIRCIWEAITSILAFSSLSLSLSLGAV